MNATVQSPVSLHIVGESKQKRFAQIEAAYQLYLTFSTKEALLLCEQNICSLQTLKDFWNSDTYQNRYLDPILD